MTVTVPGDTPDFLGDIQGAVDVLLPTQSLALVGGNVTETFTIAKSYQAIIVTCSPTGVSGVDSFLITLKDQAGNQYYTKTYTRSMEAALTYEFVLPVPCAAPGTLAIEYSTGGGGATVFWGIAGSVIPMAGMPGPFRPDARPYPNADHEANSFQTALGTTVLVAPPGLGQRLLVAGTQLSQNNATGLCNIAGTINGSSALLGALAGAASVARSWPQGVLLDDNTGLDLAIGAAVSDVYATAEYDIVS